MIKETVQAVGVTHIVTESGSKTLLGNRQFEIGDSVWTHGNYAFGTERNNPAPLILPTGIVPAEPGHYIVEFYVSDYLFKIRDVSTMQVVAEITTPISDNSTPSPKFCYDADTLTFYAVSGGANYGEGVTIHTVANGVYTTELVDLPSGGYCSDVTCRVVNHQLTWIAFVNNDFKYEKWSKIDGTPYNVVSGTVAFYEYISTELQNTYDYTSRVNAVCSEAWETINANYNAADVLTWTESNELSQEVGHGEPIPYTTTEYEVTILRRPAMADNGNYQPLGTYNYAGNYFYPITSYGPQYPRIITPTISLISFEKKLISVNVTATSYLFLGANRLYGTADMYAYQYIRNGPYGQLQSKRKVLLDDSANYTIRSSDTFVKEAWDLYSSIMTPVTLKLINLGNGYGIDVSYNLTITYNGPNTSTTNTYNGEWQQPLDYGYCVDVGATVVWNGYNVSFDYTAAINDGGGWTHDITNDFGYNPRYPDFLSLDASGNIIYYSGWQDVLYLIDKATHAVTTIHSDPLYNQMQMPLIEGFKDAIVASLTTT